MGNPRPEMGDNVYFMSGRLLGHVVEVRDDAFRCTSPDDTESWISPEAVFTVEGSRVTLICERDGLQNYLVKG